MYTLNSSGLEWPGDKIASYQGLSMFMKNWEGLVDFHDVLDVVCNDMYWYAWLFNNRPCALMLFSGRINGKAACHCLTTTIVWSFVLTIRQCACHRAHVWGFKLDILLSVTFGSLYFTRNGYHEIFVLTFHKTFVNYDSGDSQKLSCHRYSFWSSTVNGYSVHTCTRSVVQ